jgi:hypothetical protein
MFTFFFFQYGSVAAVFCLDGTTSKHLYIPLYSALKLSLIP